MLLFFLPKLMLYLSEQKHNYFASYKKRRKYNIMNPISITIYKGAFTRDSQIYIQNHKHSHPTELQNRHFLNQIFFSMSNECSAIYKLGH